MTSKTLTLPVATFLFVLFLSTTFAIAATSPVIVPPLPPTVPSSSATVAELSPVIVPPLPPTVPSGHELFAA